MNHAITIGGLLLSIGALGGFLTAAFAALKLFAEGMSDAPPQEGQSAGCVFVIAGIAVLIACVVGLIA